MKQYGKLFVISGPSGTGKGTICNALTKNNDRLVVSVSMTTRQPRNSEVHGTHYYFVDVAEFEDTIAKDGLLEYAKVYENYYGTPRKMVMDELAKGRDVLLEIDIQGAMKVKKAYPQGVFIFILPPSLKKLRERIENRGTDSKEVIDLRMSKAAGEIQWLKEYDYYVINDDFEEAVTKTKEIMSAAHQKVDARIDTVVERYKEDN